MHKILAKFRKDGDKDKHTAENSDEEYQQECERDEQGENKENKEVEVLNAVMDELRLDSKYSSLDMFEKRVILGTGTFGRVYLVRHRMTKRFYAMKELRKREVVQLKQVDHVIAEKTILGSINHPFIVNLYKSLQDEKQLYMVMEYVIGGELFTHLRHRNRFSNATAMFYAAEIVLAFEYLHSLDIIYRDLKPENLLIDKEGHIKITDFGFAKRVPDRTWTLCGTPEYLAPEIIQSKGHGKAVDWWSLGILIFEMLAGFPPFYDDNHFALYEKICECHVTFPRHIQPAARDLISLLLNPDKSRRLGSLKGGASDIKNHKWFKSVSWDDLLKRKIQGPIIPEVQHDGDTNNFQEYDEEPDTDITVGDPYKELFKDF